MSCTSSNIEIVRSLNSLTLRSLNLLNYFHQNLLVNLIKNSLQNENRTNEDRSNAQSLVSLSKKTSANWATKCLKACCYDIISLYYNVPDFSVVVRSLTSGKLNKIIWSNQHNPIHEHAHVLLKLIWSRFNVFFLDCILPSLVSCC